MALKRTSLEKNCNDDAEILDDDNDVVNEELDQIENNQDNLTKQKQWP